MGARLGLARRASPIPAGGAEADVHLFSVETAEGAPLSGRPSRESSGGAGLSPADAKRAALGELIEGYCASFFDRGQLLVGPFAELTARAPLVDPARFALYAPAQHEQPGFPFARFDHRTVVAWTRGTSVVSGAEALVPACTVYMPYVRTPAEADIGPTISTGLAAGPSLQAATLSGLLECIERDAFTLFWLNRSPVRAVDVTSPRHHPVAELFRHRLARPGFRYAVYEMPTDLGVTAIVVVLASPSPRGTIYSIGAAARADGADATAKALIEAVQGRSYVQHLLAQAPDWQPKADFSDVVDFPLAAKLYSAVPRLAGELEGIADRVTARVAVGDLPAATARAPAATLARLAGRFRDLGYELVAVDVTTRDIGGLGLSVVRVVAPELQRLHAHHRYPFLGGRRLYELPVKLGHRASPPDAADFNPLPHPFP
jgi:ribosomal protein S12 methylthiotransferase accessory factor